MKKNTFKSGLILLTACFSGLLLGQDPATRGGEYASMEFARDGQKLLYRIMYPLHFDETQSYPLVLFLHGSGERGSDNQKQLVHGSRLFRDSLDKYPAIVVFPQCPESDYWVKMADFKDRHQSHNFEVVYEGKPNPAMGLVMDLMRELLDKPYVDPERFYVTGLSMGGMGTFEFSWRMHDRVAASMPICGAGPTAYAVGMKDVPMWIFHGIKDDVVRPGYSIAMLGAIQAAGGRARITLYPEANHNSWDPAFADPEFLSWMFSKRRTLKK